MMGDYHMFKVFIKNSREANTKDKREDKRQKIIKFFNERKGIFDINKKLYEHPSNTLIIPASPISKYVKIVCNENGILTIYNRVLDDTTHRAYNFIRIYYNLAEKRYIFYTEYVKTYTTELNGALYKLFLEVNSDNKLQDFCDIYNIERSYFAPGTNNWTPLTNRIFTMRKFSYIFNCINYCIIG